MGQHKVKQLRPVAAPTNNGETASADAQAVNQARDLGVGFAPALDASYAFILFRDGLVNQVVTNGDNCSPVQLLSAIEDLERGTGETIIVDTPPWEDPDPHATYLYLTFPKPGATGATLFTRNMTIGNLYAALTILRRRAEMNLDMILRGQADMSGVGMLGAPRGPAAPIQIKRSPISGGGSSGIAAIAERLKIGATQTAGDKIDQAIAGAKS